MQIANCLVSLDIDIDGALFQDKFYSLFCLYFVSDKWISSPLLQCENDDCPCHSPGLLEDINSSAVFKFPYNHKKSKKS